MKLPSIAWRDNPRPIELSFPKKSTPSTFPIRKGANREVMTDR